MKFKKLLTIGAHPDDIELHAYGLIQKIRPRFFKQVVCSSGEIEEAKSQIRHKEQKKASQLLGSELYWLGLPLDALFGS